MTTDTWKDSTGDWSTNTDWSDGIPATGDSVVINTAQLDTITFDGSSPSVNVASLTVGDDNFVVDDSGNTLGITTSASFGKLLEVEAGTINFNAVNASIASFDQTGGTVSGTGTLTVTGSATFGGSSVDQEEGSGTTLLKGATTDAGGIALDGGYVLENAGTFDVTNGARFDLGLNNNGSTAGNSTIQNDKGGTFDFQTAATIYNHFGTNAFVNAGTLEQTVTTGTTNIGVTVDNTGTVSVQSGTLEFSGGGTFSGTFTVASGATLDFSGGTYTLSFMVSGASIGGAGVFEQTGGTISGPGTLIVTASATFSGNVAEQTGTGTTLLKGATTDSGGIALDGGRVLENAGTFDVMNGGRFDLGYNYYGSSAGNSTIQNDKGGTFDFQTAAAIYNHFGTNAFVNAGTLEQTVTTGTTDIGVTVDNTGTVSVKTGTLEFSGGGASSSAGTLTVASGTTLDFGGGTFTLSGGSIGGAGVAQVSGGALAVAANSTIASGFAQTGGTVEGSATLTVTGSATFGGNDQTEGAGRMLLEGVTTDAGGIALDGGYVLENAGTFDVTNGARFDLGLNNNGSTAGNSTIQNDKGGTFDFQTAATIYNHFGTNAFVNAGTLEQTVTTGTTNIGVTVDNSGTVSVQSGTLEFSGGGTFSGTFTVASGATLDFSGGTYTPSFMVSGASIGGAGVFEQTGGTISGPGTLIVTASATFSGNVAEQTGTGTTLLKGATTDSGGIALDGGRVLENAGTFDVMNGGRFDLGYNYYGSSAGNSTIQNDKGGTFDFQTAAAIYNHFGTNAFVNAGTLEQTVTTGTTSIDVALTNTGTVSVQTGTLDLSGGLTNLSGSTLTGGAYSVGAGAVLELANNATIITDDANITLRGKSSTIQSFSTNTNDQVSFDSTIRTIGTSGQLHLLAGRSLTTAAAPIGDDGLVQLGGGTLTVTGVGSSLTIGAGGKLLGFGVVNATTLTNSGLIEASGGTLTVQNAVMGKGSVQIDAKATLVLGGSTVSGSTAMFNGAGATLTLDKPASFASTTGGVGLDDTFNLVGVTANGASVNGSNQLVVTENGATVDTLQLSGNNSGFDFVTKAVAGGTDIISLPIPASVADYLDVPTDYDLITGGFAISDTAAKISSGLNSLNDPKINSITISDNGAVGVDVAQLTSDLAAIGKLKNANGSPYQLAVTDSLPDIVDDLSELNGDLHISSLTGTSGAATLSSGATVAAQALTLTGSSTALTLAEILTYSGSFSADAGSTVGISSGDALTLTGTDAFSSATMSGAGALDANGTTTAAGLTIGGTTTFSDGGTLTESGGSNTLGDSAGDVAKLAIAAAGTWDIKDNSGIAHGSSDASYIDNAGKFEKTGGTGTSTIAPYVINTGTIDVATGTLDFSAAVYGKGTDTISGASTLEFGAGVSTASTLGDQDIGSPPAAARSISWRPRAFTARFPTSGPATRSSS